MTTTAVRDPYHRRCTCDWVDIGVGYERVNDVPDCPEHGHPLFQGPDACGCPVIQSMEGTISVLHSDECRMRVIAPPDLLYPCWCPVGAAVPALDNQRSPHSDCPAHGGSPSAQIERQKHAGRSGFIVPGQNITTAGMSAGPTFSISWPDDEDALRKAAHEAVLVQLHQLKKDVELVDHEALDEADLAEIEARWLKMCPVHDGGVPGACECIEADPRSTIAKLLDEVRRLRASQTKQVGELVKHQSMKISNGAIAKAQENAPLAHDGFEPELDDPPNHGYTRHGWPCCDEAPWEGPGDRPESRARCGGPGGNCMHCNGQKAWFHAGGTKKRQQEKFIPLSHGLTSHGHMCCSLAPPVVPPLGAVVARCGGPVLCRACQQQSGWIHTGSVIP